MCVCLECFLTTTNRLFCFRVNSGPLAYVWPMALSWSVRTSLTNVISLSDELMNSNIGMWQGSSLFISTSTQWCHLPSLGKGSHHTVQVIHHRYLPQVSAKVHIYTNKLTQMDMCVLSTCAFYIRHLGAPGFSLLDVHSFINLAIPFHGTSFKITQNKIYM